MSYYGTEVSEEDKVAGRRVTVNLASVGNPDFGQDPYQALHGVPPKKVAVGSLEMAALACSRYIAKHALGGGNWAGGQVYEGEALVALVSYNGRVWHPGNADD
jgi:hypothetical protein